MNPDKKYHYLFIAIILFTIPVFAQVNKDFYLKKNFDTKKIVASVDSVKITAEEFYLSYEFGPAFVKKVKDSRQKHLNYMLDEKLLALDGYSRKIDTTEEVMSMVDEFRNDIATEELFKDEILPKIVVKDSDVEKIINQKQTTVEIKWLFAKDEEGIKNLRHSLNNGISFDSLFALQFKDSVAIDDRYMKTDRYQLENKNPGLAYIIDSLKAGEVSVPIRVQDGWYIVKLVNFSHDMITTQSTYQDLKQEASNSVIKKGMDSLSDNYVKELMLKNKPVIKRDAFDLVRGYIGKLYLKEDKYKDWQLEEKLNHSLKNIAGDINNASLISLTNKNITIKEFLEWYRNRSTYIKLNDTNVRDFSISLENLIWRMVRDNLLSTVAKEKGYNNSAEVIKQSSWWKDKIVGSAVRNEIAASAVLENKELNISGKSGNKSDAEKLNTEFQAKLLHKLLALKQKYKIIINDSELNAVPVSAENEPTAIDVYIVKKGGLIPRTPYPTINHEWINWE